jgi:predicted Rossmann fold nucleotide-binding protein DprA/Smf involved in DNA uptake
MTAGIWPALSSAIYSIPEVNISRCRSKSSGVCAIIPGPRTFRTLINHFGDARAALEALPALARRGGSGGAPLICSRQQVEHELAAANKLGAVFIAVSEPDYPHRLQMIDDAPPLLAVRGNRVALAAPTIAIVLRGPARAPALLFAVPGSPLDPRAEGTNGLLKQGATPVTEAADIVSAVRPIMGLDLPAREPEISGGELMEGAEPDNSGRSQIMSLLGPAPVSVDDLIRLSKASPRAVRIVLLELEIAGRLERHGGALVSLV